MIGLLKQKYKILESPLPINLIKHKSDGQYACIDTIVTVCAVLMSLSDPVIQNELNSVECVHISDSDNNHLQIVQYHFPFGFLVTPTHL